MPEAISMAAASANDPAEGEAGGLDLHLDEHDPRHPVLCRCGHEDEGAFGDLPDGKLLRISKIPHCFLMRLRAEHGDEAHCLFPDDTLFAVKVGGSENPGFQVYTHTRVAGLTYTWKDFQSRHWGWGHTIFHICECSEVQQFEGSVA